MPTLPVAESLALGAALCWAVGPFASLGPSRALGAFGFNLVRQAMVTAMLAAAVVVGGRDSGLAPGDVGLLVLSGLIGIFLGDTVLFVGMNRLGPRRNGALFALNAPMAALAGWLVLGETLPGAAVLGTLVCAAGVALAVLGRPGRSGTHRFEAVQGPLWQGIGFGLLAAAGQAAGALVARPVMAGGADPVAASLIRVGVAAAALAVLFALRLPGLRLQARLTPALLGQTALSGFVGMGLGMTLLMAALASGKVGIVSTLSATSPVLILPLLWAATGAAPSATSWAGAALACAGMALIFLR